ncbi:hypothetical protein [Cupriavidus metallidurans]|uniref:hypothetical protein n=1 Tax=Cupriavidus metallidurans TaxID=119219 RepID=UPI00055E26C8|nr:hypothetical protein [Cupriavidus metallidurans]
MAKNNKHVPHEPFSRLPHHVQFSPAFRSLSATARALLLDIIAKERGHNNGDLIVTRSTFGDLGWTSNAVFRRALDALLVSGLLILTAEGRQHFAARYGLSWLPLVKTPHQSASATKKNAESRTFSGPRDGPILHRETDRMRSTIRTVSAIYGPRDGPYVREKEGSAVRETDWVASCQGCEGKEETNGARWTPGDGPAMTVYVGESQGAFSVSVRPSIQRERITLCTDAIQPDAVMAARRALAIATQHRASLRLVGTTEALRAFAPILTAAKARGGLS